METFVRFVASQDVDSLPERSITRVWAFDARAIVALLPEPVDADERDADAIMAMAGGKCWEDPGARLAMVAAIRRGRALAAGA